LIVSDEAVLVALKGAEVNRAVDDFYRAHYLPVLRVVAAITGDRSVAEEVTQEAFLVAQRSWVRVSQYERPDLWVRRVAVNRAVSWRRRIAAEARALLRLRSKRSEAAAGLEVASPVWRYVRELPKRQAAMIALVYVEDLSIETAAHVLGIGVPTAKTHLQRARRALAARIDEERDDA
jgi:RNA polymerase sigma-70 factor (ECF subfamily)